MISASSTLANAEGFYKWKDAHGNTQYSDEPPKNIKAKKVKMPDITVLEGFGGQWKSPNINPVTPIARPVKKTVSTLPVVAPEIIKYTTLAFIAPKAGQVIQAENGDVSAMLSIKPPLKKGHNIIFLLDGKEAIKNRSRIANFPSLSNGAHTLSVDIISKGGDVLQSSSAVSFRVMR